MNPIQVMEEATKVSDAASEQQEAADITAKINAANEKDKELHAWNTWLQYEQTKKFVRVLEQYMTLNNLLIAHNARFVTSVSPEYIRARLVESSLVYQILTQTMRTGELTNDAVVNPETNQQGNR